MSKKLIQPAIEYKNEYISMIEEWSKTEEKMVPFVLRYDYSDFEGFIEEMYKLKKGINLKNTVCSSTYWFVTEKREVIGVVNIRHKLNERLMNIGGHIGYGIRPTKRMQGNATELLRQSLDIARGMHIERVLLTCDKDNIGSAKTIINNGGILESEDVVDGIEVQRYWIDTKNA